MTLFIFLCMLEFLGTKIHNTRLGVYRKKQKVFFSIFSRTLWYSIKFIYFNTPGWSISRNMIKSLLILIQSVSFLSYFFTKLKLSTYYQIIYNLRKISLRLVKKRNQIINTKQVNNNVNMIIYTWKLQKQ